MILPPIPPLALLIMSLKFASPSPSPTCHVIEICHFPPLFDRLQRIIMHPPGGP